MEKKLISASELDRLYEKLLQAQVRACKAEAALQEILEILETEFCHDVKTDLIARIILGYKEYSEVPKASIQQQRVNIGGSYLIIAPKPEPGTGYYHTLTERPFLVDNLINFLDDHPTVDKHQVTIYELKAVNNHAHTK